MEKTIYNGNKFGRGLLQPSFKTETKTKLSFSKLVFLYILGGLVGTLWETLLNLMRGRGFVYCNGSILTPFNFVYGCGGLLIISMLKNRTRMGEVFFMGALGGGIAEYVLSFLEEAVLGTRSWDYSHKPLNINGRTTVIYMLGWGVLCLFVIFIVYRPLNKLLDAVPPKVMKAVAITLAVIIAVDFVVTAGALLRYSARHAGKAAYTRLGKFIDRIFGDAFMKKRFPAMRF